MDIILMYVTNLLNIIRILVNFFLFFCGNSNNKLLLNFTQFIKLGLPSKSIYEQWVGNNYYVQYVASKAYM